MKVKYKIKTVEVSFQIILKLLELQWYLIFVILQVIRLFNKITFNKYNSKNH